jgi:hypothetical protein
MKARNWIALFALSFILWLLVTLVLAPWINGQDVYVFRDAGWNLAQTGHFTSAALPYMNDMTPRLYAHYTPLMPFLFGIYAAIFPQNAYTGTVFNYLCGLFCAAILLIAVIKQQSSIFRTLSILAILILPIVFLTNDRPEALGIALFGLLMLAAGRAQFNAPLCGLLLALTFLAHPYIGVLGAAWLALQIILRFRDNHQVKSDSLPLALKRLAIVAIIAAAIIAIVALIFYLLDPTSLQRFVTHALGHKTGLGVVSQDASKGTLLHTITTGMLQHNIAFMGVFFITVLVNLLLIAWLLVHIKSARFAEWSLILVAAIISVMTFAAFRNQGHYFTALATLIPLTLLTIHQSTPRLRNFSLFVLLVAIVAHLPVVGVSLIQRAEELHSFHAAEHQPSLLLSKLPSRDSIVAVEGRTYDMYKPYFRHLVELDYADENTELAQVEGVANCYGAYGGDDKSLRPFPEYLNPADFQLIEKAPEHMWITLHGHRLAPLQWGYGCDLYTRIHPAASK